MKGGVHYQRNPTGYQSHPATGKRGSKAAPRISHPGTQPADIGSAAVPAVQNLFSVSPPPPHLSQVNSATRNHTCTTSEEG